MSPQTSCCSVLPTQAVKAALCPKCRSRIGVPGTKGGDWFYSTRTNEIIMDFTCSSCGNRIIMAVLIPPSMSLRYIGPDQNAQGGGPKGLGPEVG